MIRIALCDDELIERNRTKKYLAEYIEENNIQDVQITVYSSAMELLCQIEEKGRFDILLLDVFLPGLLGTEIAFQLRKLDDDCQIVFLTTSREHALDAFKVNAAQYLVKPYKKEEFVAAMRKVFEMVRGNKENYINIINRGVIHKINLHDFIYIEAQNHKQFLYFSDNSCIDLRMTMNELYSILSDKDNDFFRAGASYIVNLRKITRLEKEGMLLINGKRLPVPRRIFLDLKKAYMNVVFRGVNEP